MRGRSPSDMAGIEQGGFSFGTAFRCVDITRADTMAALFFTAVKVLLVGQMLNKPLPCFALAVEQWRYRVGRVVPACSRPREDGIFLPVFSQPVTRVNQAVVILIGRIFGEFKRVRLGPSIRVPAGLVAELLAVDGWIFAPRIGQLGRMACAEGVMVRKSRHSAPPCCSP